MTGQASFRCGRGRRRTAGAAGGCCPWREAPGDAGDAHTLAARVLTVSGTIVDFLDVLRAGAAESWEAGRPPDEPPMPLAEAAVDDVLAELAGSLRSTDMLWPRPDEDEFI